MSLSFRSDEGATVVVVAFAMTVLLGFAALAIDIGFGYNERRHDQTVADTSVMAGALEAFADDADIVDKVHANATANGIDVTGWAGCTDPDRPAGFTPLAGQECISMGGFLDGEGGTFLRVRIPDQQTDTTFGRVLGIDFLTTSADAVAKLGPEGESGVLPFGLLSGTGNGNTCLRTGPSGTSTPPCDGPETGQFFIIDSPWVGSDIPTARICNGANQQRYTGNLKHGLDHLVSKRGTDPKRDDVCDQGSPNALETQPGNGFSIDAGLWRDGDARLKQSGVTREIGSQNTSHYLDNRPLWNYIAAGSAASCSPGNFANPLTEVEKIANMNTCIADGVVFHSSIGNNPRLAIVPRFVENSWVRPPIYKSILDFEPVYINEVYFNCNGTMCEGIFYPGETNAKLCLTPPGNCKKLDVDQLGAFVLDRSMFPNGGLPDEGPGGELINNLVRLYR